MKGHGLWNNLWAPVRTGWTDVGALTVTGRYCQIGNIVFFEVNVVPGTSVATVAGTSYIELPVTANPSATVFIGFASMVNLTTLVAVGLGVNDTANSRCYVPSQAATANTLLISGCYEA